MRIVVATLMLVLCLSVSAQEAYVDGNVIAFSSIDAYDRYASGELDRSIFYYYAYSNSALTTRAEVQEGENDEELWPDFLNLVLNQDKIMRISSFLVKVDLDNGFALAINANEPNAYWSLQNNDFWAPGMIYFDSESEDALEVLESIEYGGGWETWMASQPRDRGIDRQRQNVKRPATTRVASDGSCSGAARNKCEGDVVWDVIDADNPQPGCIYWMYRMDWKVVYQKAIFYFSLQSKQKSIKGCSSTNWVLVPTYDAQLQLNGNARYRKRCGGEVVKQQLLTDVDREQNWRPYEGSRSLSHYDVAVTFGIAHPGQTNYHYESCAITDGYSAGHAGMTWRSLENRPGVVHVGSDNVTNPYNGDTAPNVSLPVLCLRYDGSATPSNVSPDFYNGWAGGPVALTPAVQGSTLTSRATADSLCSSNFGAGWRMGEFHDGRYGPSLQYSGGWSWWAYGNIPVGQRFWAAINDQPANPWN